MTEKLKTLMDEVTGMVDQDFATPDLDAIVRTGDRTVRRRRIAAGAAALAVVAAVSTGVVLLGDDGDSNAGFAGDDFARDVPVWAEGSALHVAGRTYDLGVDVVTLVRTADGVAYIGDDSGVYAFDGRESDRIGTSVDSEWAGLVGDSDGPWVGWISDGDERDFVAHDLATGAEFRDPVQVDPQAKKPWDTGMFLAIDGSIAYRLDGRGTTTTDLASGDTTVVGKADDPVLIVAAEGGVTVRWVENSTGGDLGTDVVGADGKVLLGHQGGRSVGALSPDGVWAAGLDDASAWRVATGERVALDTGSPADAIGYDWLDDDTLMVLAEVPDSEESIRLMQCEVPTGTCSDVTELDFSGTRVALPSFGLFSAVQFGGVTTSSSSGEATVVESSAASSTEKP